MRKGISPVNLEIYDNVVRALKVGSQRPDLTHVADEIKINKTLIIRAYRDRGVKSYWDGMYGQLVGFADNEAEKQRKRSGEIVRIPAANCYHLHRH